MEKATGQPKLKRLYLDNQRFPRPSESFWPAAVRSLELDVATTRRRSRAFPKTGPMVFVANHPYGVLDGIVISWLVQKVRPDFLVLTNAVLMRAQEVRDYVLPIDFSGHRGGASGLKSSGRRRARSSRGAARWWCFRPAAFRRRPTPGAPAGGGCPLAAFRRPAHSALEGDVAPIWFGGQNSRLFQIASHRQPDAAPLVDLSRSEGAHRHELAGGDRRADPVRGHRRDQGPAGDGRSFEGA